MFQKRIEGNNVICFESNDQLVGLETSNWKLSCDSYEQFGTGILQSGEGAIKNYLVIRFKHPFSEKINHIINNSSCAIKYLVFVWNEGAPEQRIIVSSNPTNIYFPITNTQDVILSCDINTNKGNGDQWNENFGSKLALKKIVYEII